VRLRQSDIKKFTECPLKYRFANIDNLPREQSSALSWGTTMHEAVYVMEGAHSLQDGIDHFCRMWDDLASYDLVYDYLLPRNTHERYRSEGIRILKELWLLYQWDTDVVLGREIPFEVPLGDNHTLTGTMDKLALRTLKGGEQVILVSDYKTNAKLPTRSYLRHDVQFTAYAYATTQLEFWQQFGQPSLHYDLLDLRRVGEWVHLRGPQKIDAGERVAQDYERLRMVADGMELTIAFGAYVPTLTGTSCEFCEFRVNCGLPAKENP
jgi:CRISPR/Cas system-associated exonuclease Cas4 (RecB family)